MYILYRGVASRGRGVAPPLRRAEGGRRPPLRQAKDQEILFKTSFYSLKYYKIARDRKDRKEWKAWVIEKGKEEEYMLICTYIRRTYILNSQYWGREIGSQGVSPYGNILSI